MGCTYPYMKYDEDFFSKLLIGKTNLKLVIWKKLRAIQIQQYFDKSFEEVYEEFLEGEFRKLVHAKNAAEDLFENMDLKSGWKRSTRDLEELKYEKARHVININRLEMFTKLNLIHGP